MSDEEEFGRVIPFILGPGPRQVRPAAPKPPKPTPPAPRLIRPQLPTKWVQTAPNVFILENPNVCSICHRAVHGPTAHHSFDPDRASVTIARALGWPMPPNQE